MNTNFEMEFEQNMPELEQSFEENLKFLEKFAFILNLGNGQAERVIAGKELAPISPKYENYEGYVVFNTDKIYYEFKQELGNLTGDQETDVSNKVLEIFASCLNLILFLLREETEPMKILQLYKRFYKCIIIFSKAPIILNTGSFNNMVTAWIFDLLKIITCADGASKLVPGKYAIFNTIKWILLSLGRTETFRENIITAICHNLKCAVSFCAANDQFNDYVFTKSMTLEYLIWTLRDLVYNAATSKILLDNVSDNIPIARIRLVLESLKKYLGDKLPSSIAKLIDDIFSL